jgi:hypothetical protein
MDDLAVLKSPNLWPHFPYLRVERRTDMRAGMPFCFLRAASEVEVEPYVLMGPSWPPAEEVEIDQSYGFSYDSIDEIAAAGWKIVYLF